MTLSEFRKRFEDVARSCGVTQSCTLDVDHHDPPVQVDGDRCLFKFDYSVTRLPAALQQSEIKRALRRAFEVENPPYSGYRKKWFLKTAPTGSKVCYRTKTNALLVLLDANRELVDDYGGEDAGLPASFDAINNRYGLKGERRVDNIAKAVWWALPGPKPWCLENIDLELLNDTAPARHNPRGLSWRLPDFAEEARLAEQQEAYWQERAKEIGFPEEEVPERDVDPSDDLGYPAFWDDDEPVDEPHFKTPRHFGAEADDPFEYPSEWDTAPMTDDERIEETRARLDQEEAERVAEYQRLRSLPSARDAEIVDVLDKIGDDWHQGYRAEVHRLREVEDVARSEGMEDLATMAQLSAAIAWERSESGHVGVAAPRWSSMSKYAAMVLPHDSPYREILQRYVAANVEGGQSAKFNDAVSAAIERSKRDAPLSDRRASFLDDAKAASALLADMTPVDRADTDAAAAMVVQRKQELDEEVLLDIAGQVQAQQPTAGLDQRSWAEFWRTEAVRLRKLKDHIRRVALRAQDQDAGLADKILALASIAAESEAQADRNQRTLPPHIFETIVFDAGHVRQTDDGEQWVVIPLDTRAGFDSRRAVRKWGLRWDFKSQYWTADTATVSETDIMNAVASLGWSAPGITPPAEGAAVFQDAQAAERKRAIESAARGSDPIRADDPLAIEKLQARADASYGKRGGYAKRRRIAERIEKLKKGRVARAQLEASDADLSKMNVVVYDQGETYEDVASKRLVIAPFKKPPDTKPFKRARFRWAPSKSRWQRQLTDNARIRLSLLITELGWTRPIEPGDNLDHTGDSPATIEEIANAVAFQVNQNIPGFHAQVDTKYSDLAFVRISGKQTVGDNISIDAHDEPIDVSFDLSAQAKPVREYLEAFAQEMSGEREWAAFAAARQRLRDEQAQRAALHGAVAASFDETVSATDRASSIRTAVSRAGPAIDTTEEMARATELEKTPAGQPGITTSYDRGMAPVGVGEEGYNKQAYRDGVRSYFADGARYNPYAPGSKKFSEWAIGYDRALQGLQRPMRDVAILPVEYAQACRSDECGDLIALALALGMKVENKGKGSWRITHTYKHPGGRTDRRSVQIKGGEPFLIEGSRHTPSTWRELYEGLGLGVVGTPLRADWEEVATLGAGKLILEEYPLADIVLSGGMRSYAVIPKPGGVVLPASVQRELDRLQMYRRSQSIYQAPLTSEGRAMLAAARDVLRAIPMGQRAPEPRPGFVRAPAAGRSGAERQAAVDGFNTSVLHYREVDAGRRTEHPLPESPYSSKKLRDAFREGWGQHIDQASLLPDIPSFPEELVRICTRECLGFLASARSLGVDPEKKSDLRWDLANALGRVVLKKDRQNTPMRAYRIDGRRHIEIDWEDANAILSGLAPPLRPAFAPSVDGQDIVGKFKGGHVQVNDGVWWITPSHKSARPGSHLVESIMENAGFRWVPGNSTWESSSATEDNVRAILFALGWIVQPGTEAATPADEIVWAANLSLDSTAADLVRSAMSEGFKVTTGARQSIRIKSNLGTVVLRNGYPRVLAGRKERDASFDEARIALGLSPGVVEPAPDLPGDVAGGVADYEERQEERRERLEAGAAKSMAKMEQALAPGREFAKHFGGGEPIKVGHHSERRHRRDLERMERAEDRAYGEHYPKAKELARRAAKVGTGGISSDDPTAMVQLREKIEKATADQATMKENNKRFRKLRKKLGDRDALVEIYNAETADAILADPLWRLRQKPHPSYQLSNNNVNIKRMEARLRTLAAERTRAQEQEVDDEGRANVVEYNGGRTYEDIPANRVVVEPDSHLGKDLFRAVKREGFRWSRQNKRFQRQLNDNGRWAAERAIKVLGWTKGSGEAVVHRDEEGRELDPDNWYDIPGAYPHQIRGDLARLLPGGFSRRPIGDRMSGMRALILKAKVDVNHG